MKAPSNSIPNSELIVTGLNANQKIVQAVFARMNKEMPEPNPQPLLNISSSRMTIKPAPINCPTIRAIVSRLISEGKPQFPYQMDATASPKQKITAKILSKPCESFSSWAEVILKRPIAAIICIIQPAEIIGEIPNSIRVPLLDAIMTLAQQSGSESCVLTMPQSGICEQTRQMNNAIAVKTVLCCMVSGAMGFSILGKRLANGLRGLSRFIFITIIKFDMWSIFRKCLFNKQQQQGQIQLFIEVFWMSSKLVLYFHERMLLIHIIQKMAGDITLLYDIDSVSTLNSEKVLVAVPLLYLFMTHYLFQMLRLIKGVDEVAERLNDLGKRMFLYGVACLFSLNFLQSSVIGAACAWIILVIMIVAHCFAFLRETGQRYHNGCLLIFYSVLMVWFGCELAYFVLGGL